MEELLRVFEVSRTILRAHCRPATTQISPLEGFTHRVIPHRGTVAFFKIGAFCWPFLAIGITSAHNHTVYVRWFKKDGRNAFFRFAFVCFTYFKIQTSRTKLNSMIKINYKKQTMSWVYKFSSIYKITPLLTQRKGGSI